LAKGDDVKKQVLSLGAGWFALQAIWTTYNAFMPLFYRQLTSAPDPVSGLLVPNLFLVGLLMTTDNITGLALQPFWGARSDLTRSRFGRRLPYILVGMPLAAVFTFILPFFAHISLIALVGVAILMNISMTVFRAPLVALFADLFPRHVRTQVSGATDLCAGIGAIVALVVGGQLFNINPLYPFLMVAGFLIIAAVVLGWGVKEPAPETDGEQQAGDLPPTIPAAVRTLFSLPQKSPLLFLVGIFFTWTAWNGIESFWTTYATTALGMQGGDAANFAAILALSYLVSAVPAGFAAARFGRQRTILAGQLLLIPLYIICALNTSKWAFAGLLAVLGLCWALVLVNGVILFQEFASIRQIGLFSGMFSIGTALAQIVGPPSYGLLMDNFGPQSLWYAGLGALIIGALFVSRVREGQVHAPDEAVAAAAASPS
jgi:maltose/moltooligosaccharide transporter